MKIRVAICLEDTLYAEKISSFFTTHHGDSVEIYSFSEQERLFKYLETHVMDVLLTDEAFDDRAVAEWPEMLLFKFTGGSVTARDNDSTIYISKYQRASTIYQEILHYSAKRSEFSVRKGVNKTITISFASVSGGAGSTTIATAFAIYLARQGRKVLFLNMDEFEDTSVFLGEGGKYSFEEIILSLKTKNRNLPMRLQSAVSRTDDEVFFYSSCPNPVDFSQLSAGESKELLGSISTMDYQYVVIDFHLGINDRTKAIMNASDKIVLVSDGTEQTKQRFGRIMKALRSIDGMDRTRNTDKLAIFNNKIEKGKGIDISSDSVPNIGSIASINLSSPKEIAQYIAARVDCFGELG